MCVGGGEDGGEKETTKVEMKFCCAVCDVISSPYFMKQPIKSTLPSTAFSVLLREQAWDTRRGSVFEEPVSEQGVPKGLSLNGTR